MPQSDETEARMLALFRAATEQQKIIAIGMLEYVVNPQEERMHVIVGYSGPS